MRPINSMVEFKQIIGRGTRLFEGKEYFTIIDFVDAYKLFFDPEWDGEPIDLKEDKPHEPSPIQGQESGNMKGEGPRPPKEKIRIKLADGKAREIQHMVSTAFLSADGKPISAEEYLRNMFGTLPEFFKSEKELREIWAYPKTRKVFLDKIAALGYGKEQLETMQKMVNAEDSDLFDVLAYVSFAIKPISKEERASETETGHFEGVGRETSRVP